MEGPTDKNKPAAVLRKLNKISATIPKAKIRVKKTKKVSIKDPTFNQRSIREFLIANNTNSEYEEHTQQLKILGAPVNDGLCPVSILEGGAVRDSPGIEAENNRLLTRGGTCDNIPENIVLEPEKKPDTSRETLSATRRAEESIPGTLGGMI